MNMVKLALIAGLAAAPAQLCAEELSAPGTALSTSTAAAAAAAAPAAKAKAQTVGLPDGYRGVSIPVGGDQLLYLKKGDRVDVLVTFDAKMSEDGQERKEKITATFLQNIVVINLHKPEKVDGVGAIELMLNPVEAQYAALGVAQGNINITVRAPGDLELHPMEMASFRKLIK